MHLLFFSFFLFSPICCRPVAKTHDSIQCNNCDIQVHRECNKINKQTYKLLQKNQICTKEFLPFSNLNKDFINTLKRQKH